MEKTVLIIGKIFLALLLLCVSCYCGFLTYTYVTMKGFGKESQEYILAIIMGIMSLGVLLVGISPLKSFLLKKNKPLKPNKKINHKKPT